MKKYVNGKYVDLTDDEVELVNQEKNEWEDKYLQDKTYDEAVNLKIRERYTESQEFAILRQKDEKPAEFIEYYEYCEQCKKSVKALLK